MMLYNPWREISAKLEGNLLTFNEPERGLNVTLNMGEKIISIESINKPEHLNRQTRFYLAYVCTTIRDHRFIIWDRDAGRLALFCREIHPGKIAAFIEYEGETLKEISEEMCEFLQKVDIEDKEVAVFWSIFRHRLRRYCAE